MTAVLYRKIGEHRGKRRLWLEGGCLSSQGISPEQRFDVEVDAERKRLTIELKEDGARKVSGRTRGDRRLPIIDIATADLGALFGEAERVRVVVQSNVIVVTLHHLDVDAEERFRRMLDKLTRGKPLTIGSLAHGGGVLDHAIHQGLEQGSRGAIRSRLNWAVEVEQTYLDASLSNNPVWSRSSTPICAPMEEVEYRRLPKVEMLIAGLPCTGASRSGITKNRLKHAEDHETAGALFVAFLDAIRAANPALILLENVPLYAHTASMSVIRAMLRHLGYEVHERVLDGHAFGALEKRERLCMVAIDRGIADVLPEAFDLEMLTPVRAREETIGEILEDVEDDSDRWRTYDYLNAKAQRDKAEGKGFKRQVLDASATFCGTMGRGYHKARGTEPFLAHASGDGRQRLFTPIEHARLKTIPEELVRGLASTIAHQVLGQSVIHCAFRAVGCYLGRLLANVKDGQRELPLVQAAA